jgi:hypothetical protein
MFVIVISLIYLLGLKMKIWGFFFELEKIYSFYENKTVLFVKVFLLFYLISVFI